ncbi:MAG: 50S ribosomal protein L9 [Coriobacteriia bacterium]|nr:50S ribosomal protein L9 [Coriobacteriia bacterium]
MKVILLQEVKGRGGEGDVIDVKDGFANNYLIKDGLAVKATKGALKQLEERRKNIEKREEVRLAEANELKAKIDNLKFKVDVQIGDEGQLFGAVTSQMIADGIKKNADVEIDKRRIDIRKAIKTVGLHKAEVVIYRDIKANIEVIVGDEDAEKFMEALKAKKERKSGAKGGKKPAKKDAKKEDKDGKKDEEKVEDKKEDKPEEKAEEKTEEPKEEEKPAEEKTEEPKEEGENKE